ncbi:MAG TPA: dihydrofolate reductase family protein [Propionibacteriaceae bacterium]
MGTVVAQASMSLDGYIAKADNSIGRLFDWYQAGDVEVKTATSGITFHLTRTSADYWREATSDLGAIVCGRTLFDFVDGWGGRHTIDAPVVVVTHRVPTEWVRKHPDAPFEFVTDGVAAALARAQEIAGARTVAVTAGTIAAQCLQLGLLDVVAIDLVPVVMGGGRPFFPGMAIGDVALGDPEVCVPSARVTHLRVPVRKGDPS